MEYGEANGQTGEEKVFGTYEGSRYFSSDWYGFGLARFQYDGFLTDTSGSEVRGEEIDAFIGAGPGYRIISENDQTWRVQAGPDVRYFEDVNGVDDTELGFIVSSRYFYSITDTMAFTKDTLVIGF